MPTIVLAPIIRAPFHNIDGTFKKKVLKIYSHDRYTVVKTIVVSLPFISFPFVWPPMWIFILKKHKKFHGCCGSDCQRLFKKELQLLWLMTSVSNNDHSIYVGWRGEGQRWVQRPKESIGFLNVMIPLINNLTKTLA